LQRLSARTGRIERLAATVDEVTDPFHPVRNGRCPRCSAGGQQTSVFCLECGLRLRPGMQGIQASARLLSESWMRANPARADYWLTRGEPRSAHDLILGLAHAGSGAESATDIEELECWLLRDRLFASAPVAVAGPDLMGD
jgi:hypothetical protein